MQIINRCPVAIELDRAQFTLSFSASEIKFFVLEKQEIAANEIAEISLYEFISDSAAKQAAMYPDNPFSLHGHIEFNCSIHAFPKSVGALSGIQPRLMNAHARLTS